MSMTREEAALRRDDAIAKANKAHEATVEEIDRRETKLADGTDRHLIAIARRKKAYELRQQGLKYKDIAEQVGSDPQYVKTLIFQHERTLRGEHPTHWSKTAPIRC